MIADKSLVDCHVHWVSVAPAGASESRADAAAHGFLGPRMRRGWVFRLASRKLGAPPGDLPALVSAYQATLERELAESRVVRAAVILALDGVYDDHGRLDLDSTQLYVPNDAVLEAARRNPALLPGASINPARRDAVDELVRVREAGAVLVKWLPNAQGFDPSDPRFRPFFRALAESRLPLLVHAGFEHAIPSRWQQMGDPARWQSALEEGVTLVAAHAGSSGSPFRELHNPTFLRLVERYPNLYADSAALASPPRARVLKRLRRHGEALARLTFGTDYPIPSVPVLLLAKLRLAGFRAAAAERNYFDRHARVLEALGWEPRSSVLEKLCAGRIGKISPASAGGG